MNNITLGAAGTRYGASMEITGWENLQANLRTIAVKYPQELGMGLREEGMAIMEESLRICPYDQDNPHDDGTPHLNETGDVAGPYFEGDNITVELSYATPYAVLQHEIQEYAHDPPEQWKYLESPLLARARYIGPNLVKAVNLERLGIGYSAQSLGALKTAAALPNLQRRAWSQWDRWEALL